jgi:hypothetical protein
VTDATIICDVTFQVVAATRDDTGDPTVVVYVELPDDERTTFGCALSPEAAASLADTLADAAGVPSALWPAIGTS